MQPSRRKHLLVFIEVYCGPTMTFVVRQIEELLKNYDVTLISNRRENEVHYKGTPLVVPYDFSSRLVGKVLRTLGYSYCIPPLKMHKEIEAIHKQNKIDGAICHFGPAGLQISKILEKMSIPQSIIIHGYDGSSLLRNRAYVRQIGRSKHAKWIFASNSLRNNFLNNFPKLSNYKTVHLGINLPEVVEKERISILDKVRKREKLVFFQASNFVEKKGHEFTIKAFEMFVRTYSNAELIFAGSGELLLSIKELVKNLDIQPKVRFLGHLSSEGVLEFMANADVFLHHSITASNGDQESIPTVIMEAMNCGLPVISTFHSGIPELIQSGADGILVEERNVVKYYEAMVGLLADDGVISFNAKNKVNKYFSLPKNLSTIVDFTIS